MDVNPFRYCGEYFDTETETVYLRNRYYNPKLGRFSAVDPAQSGLNWYTYCGGNPLRFVDPLGLAREQLDRTPARNMKALKSKSGTTGWKSNVNDNPWQGWFDPSYKSQSQYNYSETIISSTGDKGVWTISNGEFLDRSSLSLSDLIDIFANCGNPIYEADPEYYAYTLWEACYNYDHQGIEYDASFGHINHFNNVKSNIPEGSIGINPKVLLATLKAESGFGTSTASLFGQLSSRGVPITDTDTMKLEYNSQLNKSISNYIRFYYFASYYRDNYPELYVRGDAHGTGGGSYTPANAAMFSRGQYCTEGLNSQMVWQGYFRGY